MRKLLLLIVIAALAAWRLWPVPEVRIPSGEALPVVDAPAGTRFALIRTGDATTLEAMTVANGSLFHLTRINHVAVLVEHPNGCLLFDTGLGLKVDQQFGSEMSLWAKPVFAYAHANPAATQLQAAGLAAPDRIFLSHAHWDHASAIVDFPQAEVWVPDAERSAATRGQPPAYLPSQLNDAGTRWHPFTFSGPAIAGFDASFDVFVDGSVVLLPLPGHTPGSTGLLITVPDGHRYFFIGDTVWNHLGLELPAPKFSVSSLIVDADRDATFAAVLKVRALQDANPGLIVVPAHDASVHDTIGYFPTFVGG